MLGILPRSQGMNIGMLFWSISSKTLEMPSTLCFDLS